MIEEIIEKVETLAGYEGRPIMVYGCPLFEWSTGIEVN